MTLHVKVIGTWKEVAPGGGLSAKVSGAWKTVDSAWVKVSGTWEQFYQDAVFELPSAAVHVAAGTATATVTLTDAGAYTSTGVAGGDWVTPTSLAPGSYTIQAHVNSGSTPTGSALDTDLALSATRAWTITQVGAGTTSCSLLLTLKDGGGNTVATNTCSMSAQAF